MVEKFNYYLITLFTFGNLTEKHKGTWASLLTTFFLYSLIYFFNVPILIITITLLIIFVYSFFAIKSCLVKFENDDPQEIVIDEFCGQILCLLGSGLSIQSLVLGFLIFRVLDILKPPPIKYLETFPRGWGIFLDDLFSGLIGLLVLLFLRSLISF